MNINKWTVILPIVFCTILYLLASFLAADLNILNWDTFGRAFLSLLMFFAIIAGILMANEIETN